MRAFIIMCIATIIGVAFIFAGAILMGFHVPVGWKPKPLAVAMICIGIVQTIACAIITGVISMEVLK